MQSDRTALAPPIRTLQIELSGAVDAIADRHPDGGRYGWALVLVRLHGVPLGSVTVALPVGGLPADDVRALAEAELARELAAHLAADDRLAEPDDPDDLSPSRPACLRARDRYLAAAQPLTVVVASRNRAERVVACVSALLASDHPHLDVIVVDNAPSSSATADLVEQRFAERPEVRYLREDRPGTSRARNLGLRTATSELVAFVDDDVLVDPGWAANISRPMVEDDRVGCVTGLVIPAELETDAQLWIEEYGGFAKGYRPVVHEIGGSEPEAPLFPYAAGALGTGASMAFRRKVLRSVGGFDPALGGGTPARGGEDLSPFVEVLLAGWRLAYEPTAVTRHFHRREEDALRQIMIGYGGGLSAYLTRTVVHHPGAILGMARRALSGARFLLDPRSPKNARKPATYPAELTRLELLGFACGPLWYARGVLAERPRRRWSGGPRQPGRAAGGRP